MDQPVPQTATAYGSSLPAVCYTDPAFFAAERRDVHLRHWFFVGRADEIAEPGQYRAIDTVGGPALLVRGRDGILRAFANICRHRAAPLLEGEGTCRTIICPYHAWAYRLDGTLRAAPAMEQLTEADRATLGLLPIRLQEWAGFVFLTYDDAAPDLLSHLGNLPAVFASHRLDDMVCTWRDRIETRCNWKLLLENAMETYHTGFVHAATVGAQQSEEVATEGEWQALQVISDRSIATLGDGPPPFPPIDGLDQAARRGTYFTCIYPSAQFAVAQDCLWWLAVRPLAPDRSVLELGGCFPRAIAALPDFAERAAPYYKRWRLVAEEDVGILEKQQAGLSSVLYRPGPLSWRDVHVRRMGDWVRTRVKNVAA